MNEQAAPGVAPLDIAAFRAAFPQFADETVAPDAMIEARWRVACRMIDNTPGGRIPYAPPDVETRAVILALALCHLLTLALRGGLVGTLTNATEGSVTAAASYAQGRGSRWWDQTPCGAAAWELMLPYRLGGRWIAGRGC